MKYLFLIVLFLSINIFPSIAQRPFKRPVVKKPAADPPPPPRAMRKTIGIFVEKYVLNFDVNSDGTAVQTYESQTRFDTHEALEGFGTVQKIFNGDLEKIEVLEAYYLQKKTGKKVPLGPDSISMAPTAQAEAAPAFSSLRLFEIVFPGLEVGDTAYYKYKLTTTRPHFPGHFDEFETLPAIFEWGAVEINLSAPANYPLYTQSTGLDGGKLPDENGRTRWQWHKTPAKPLEYETAMYDTVTPSARLNITSFKNYEELGAAFWASAESKTSVTPEIAELARLITKDISDPRQQASAIYEWVNKNIRYLLVILDRGGWIPHDAAQILKNGYGDCKDYTILIHTLLKAKGIESHPVIIRSDLTDWAPDVASPTFYNHAILYIPGLDLFADATAPNTRLGLIPQSIVGKQGFLAGTKTGVIHTPRDRPGENEVMSDVVVTYNDDGGMRSTSKNIYRGRSEIVFRPIFSSGKAEEYSEFFVKTLLAYYGIEGTGRLSKVGNPFKVGEPFEVEMEVDIPSLSAFMGKGSFPLPLAVNLLNMLDFQQLAIDEKRATNLVVGATHIRETFLLKFPDRVLITAVPAPVKFEGPAGKFYCEFKIEGNSVKVIRELSIDKDVFKPADYADLQALVKATVNGSSAEMAYETNSKVAKPVLPGRPAQTAPARIRRPEGSELARSLMGDMEPRTLSPTEINKLETLLLKEPENLNARRALLAHYSSYKTKKTPLADKGRLRHRIWFIQNHPELNEFAATGHYSPPKTTPDAEYEALKTEWLKQIALKPGNIKIRVNTAEYLRWAEPEAAIRVLSDAEKVDPEDYEIPRQIAEIQYARAKKSDVAESVKQASLQSSFENGERALLLVKKERSSERDIARKQLVGNLAEISLELKKYDRARTLATELILEVGSNFDGYGFQEGTHSGNIILGRVALAQGDIAKAKEHLMTAIRPLLRGKSPSFYRIDFELARELLAEGEQDAVIEYLQFCVTFREKEEDKDLYASDIKTLKSWLEQVKAGKTPSFDFYKP